MALSITSPGVQINEVDLSRTLNIPTGTSILVAGYAPQGPTDEILTVTSLSEWESIFGTPTNAAERYFYETAQPLFLTNATVNAYRLPYGANQGQGFGSNYGALVYPVTPVDVNYSNGTNANYGYTLNTFNALSSNVMYVIGAPTHFELTPDQYNNLQGGNGIAWSNIPYTQFDSISSFANAGIVVLNNGQTSINNNFAGYYLGIADNSNISPASNFTDLLAVNSLLSATYETTNYVQVPQTRLSFALSSQSENSYAYSNNNATSNIGSSVSQVLETTPTFNIGTPTFNDTLIFGLFKLTQSNFNPTTTQLTYSYAENAVGSLDYWRQINPSNGGAAKSFFIHNVNDGSPNIQIAVNPFISHKNSSTWLNNVGVPTNFARTVTSGYKTVQSATTLLQQLSTQYGITNATTAAAQVSILANSLNGIYNNLTSVKGGSVDALFPVGSFNNTNLTTKDLGTIPAKLNRLFNIASDVEQYNIDIVVDAGMSTIFANSQYFNNTPQLSSSSIYFDDTIVVTSISGLAVNNLNDVKGASRDYLEAWGEIFNLYTGFSEQTRKDCLYIADLPRNIFVQGQNYLTLSNPANNFPQNIYLPTQNILAPWASSYATTYGNWARVFDNNLGQFVWAPFSGFAAANMARMDTNFQPWFAPAGFTRGNLTGTGITDLAVFPNQKQRDQLYNIAVNPVAFFPNEGFVIYGQKTLLKQPSAFDRINVRRLFLNLEKATASTVKFFVFEPNTVLTRTRIINTLTPLFTNAKNTEGLYDFLIVCDERNNPPSVIDANTLVVDIYLKPVRTAEFILVNFYATQTSQNFSELVG